MNKNKKTKSLTTKQREFLDQLLAGKEISEIICQLEIDAHRVTSWICNNPLFQSTLNSAIYLKEISIFINNLNLRIQAIENLERYVNSGNLEGTRLAISNLEIRPELLLDEISLSRISKKRANEIIDLLDFGTEYKKRPWRKEDPNEPPF
tara:strand:- start:425 stop:874 length:450 start_codon:yes stop_codon:yes gene_type:complete